MAIVGSLKLNVQIMRGRLPAMGPGKAMVLAAVAEAGSISGAGRALGMSYRRIWLLVEALNSDWSEAVVVTKPGGGPGGGARLSAFGSELLARYRAMEARMMAAAEGSDLEWLVRSTRAADGAVPSPVQA